MSKVAVVTDSTAHIPSEMIQGLPVFIIPAHVTWGGQSYRDNVDLRPEEFFERLKVDKTMPQTSQPTPFEFTEIYRSLIEKGYEILSIHPSGRLSNMLFSAIQAKNMLEGARIEVVDSLTAAMATGFHVLQAARAAAGGASLQACKNLAEKARFQTNVFFIPDTLEFLHRGGRIGNLTAFLGSILQIKPILGMQDGLVEAIERVRSVNTAFNHLVDILVKQIGDRSPVHLAALHANIPEKAAELLERVRRRLDAERVYEAFISGISPTIGVHVGPGAFGMAYLAGM